MLVTKIPIIKLKVVWTSQTLTSSVVQKMEKSMFGILLTWVKIYLDVYMSIPGNQNFVFTEFIYIMHKKCKCISDKWQIFIFSLFFKVCWQFFWFISNSSYHVLYFIVNLKMCQFLLILVCSLFLLIFNTFP